MRHCVVMGEVLSLFTVYQLAGKLFDCELDILGLE